MNLLNEREKTHGDYADVARVAQCLKGALQVGPVDVLPDVHRESLDLICTKMARIVCGDHNEPDHWTDIMGYAKLVLKTLEVPPGSSSIQEPSDDPDYTNSDYYIPRSGLPR